MRACPFRRSWKQQGEPAFRDLETAALKNLLAVKKKAVIALGGGALLRDENRAFAESNGKVILLMAELETLLERLHYEAGKRPLLAGDLREKLSSLLGKARRALQFFSHAHSRGWENCRAKCTSSSSCFGTTSSVRDGGV